MELEVGPFDPAVHEVAAVELGGDADGQVEPAHRLVTDQVHLLPAQQPLQHQRRCVSRRNVRSAEVSYRQG